MATRRGRPDRGVIYCATGGYLKLALASAESCKVAMPDVPIDLFTDAAIQHPALDRVHILPDPWHRSKIDAMRQSRFARTIFLDADTLVRADISDIFTLLDRAELCGAADQVPNGMMANLIWEQELPLTFPQINTGVLGFRKTWRVRRLLARWAKTVRRHKLALDQAVFRELLWKSRIRFATLPMDYNFMVLNTLRGFWPEQLNPRILHIPGLNKHMKRDDWDEKALGDVLTPKMAEKLDRMRAQAEEVLGDRDKRRRWARHKRRTGGADKTAT